MAPCCPSHTHRRRLFAKSTAGCVHHSRLDLGSRPWSIRNPRSYLLVSARPRYSMSPVWSTRARSPPDLYIRHPQSIGERVLDERSSVNSGRFTDSRWRRPGGPPNRESARRTLHAGRQSAVRLLSRTVNRRKPVIGKSDQNCGSHFVTSRRGQRADGDLHCCYR